MAWRCSGRTHAELIQRLRDAAIITTPRVERAMLAVDRGKFVPSTSPVVAYADSPQSIGFGATISAPHHAYSLELLNDNLKPGANVLDVGCGSGYLAAVMAEMVGPDGSVVGIDHIEGLVELSKRNVTAARPDLLQTTSTAANTDAGRNATDWEEDLSARTRGPRLQFVLGDGRLGYPQQQPYDTIHVGAAANESVVETLCSQLKVGGRLVIPVEGEEAQDLCVYDKKSEDSIESKRVMGVIFIPLTSPQDQMSRRR